MNEESTFLTMGDIREVVHFSYSKMWAIDHMKMLPAPVIVKHAILSTGEMYVDSFYTFYEDQEPPVWDKPPDVYWKHINVKGLNLKNFYDSEASASSAVRSKWKLIIEDLEKELSDAKKGAKKSSKELERFMTNE